VEITAEAPSRERVLRAEIAVLPEAEMSPPRAADPGILAKLKAVPRFPLRSERFFEVRLLIAKELREIFRSDRSGTPHPPESGRSGALPKKRLRPGGNPPSDSDYDTRPRRTGARARCKGFISRRFAAPQGR
jgi:hypothetical protein